MRVKIAMLNEGGMLDSTIVETEEEAQQALLDMIEGLDSVQPGDRFVVSFEE